METIVIDTTYQKDVKVMIHGADACFGRRCVFHNPTKHHMSDWHMILRTDKSALVERICSHGVGHPDPDSLWFFVEIAKETSLAIHGCDGCCIPLETDKE